MFPDVLIDALAGRLRLMRAMNRDGRAPTGR